MLRPALARSLAALLALTLLASACSGDDSDSTTTSDATDQPGAGDNGDATDGGDYGALIAVAPEGDAFYAPPDPIPGEPGDVIWAREAGSVDGGELYVVLYHSENLRGESIATSGWIAVPDGDAPAEGRPIMTWGHGTRGVADQCAPTIQDDPPSADMPLLADLLARGIVVSASDYEGLGTPGLHPYVIGESEAKSMLDAARAAQRFTPAAGNDTVIVAGHSQGGHAMAFANEYAGEYAPELDVIGAVGSGAGVVDSDSGIVSYLIDSDLRGVMVLAMGAQQAAYGEELAPATRLLTELGTSELAALENGCWEHVIEYYQQFTTEELFVEDWDFTFTNGDSPDVLNSAGHRPGAAPILLVHGTEDSVIPAGFIPPYVERACEQGNAVVLEWYEGPHRIMYDDATGAADSMLAWIDARLAGEDAPSDCGAVPQP